MDPATEVQRLVDALAAELGRPVGLDSHSFRSLAYSSHPGQVDEVRENSILHREAPGEVIAWLESLRVREIEDFGRVVANPEFGMVARVCLPVRYNGLLLGFVWLTDEADDLDEGQLREARRYTDEIGIALYHRRLLEEGSREREHELLSTALAERGEESAAAARALLGEGHLAAASSYSVLIVRAEDEADVPPDLIAVRVADRVAHLRRTVAPRQTVALTDGAEAIIVLARGADTATARAQDALVTVCGLEGSSTGNARVGIGGEINEIEEVALARRRASLALTTFAALDDHRSPAAWADLGAYRSIAPLVFEGSRTIETPAALRRLLDRTDGSSLIETLECYLDLAGDSRAVAAALYLHRSSLYARLRRIEQVAEVDLHSGEDRLDLHLGIRVLRLERRLPRLTDVESKSPRIRPRSDARK